MDENTRREIDKLCWRMLRDVGISEPPVLLDPVLNHLNLYRHFYDLTDPTFLDRAKHRIMVPGRKLVDLIKKISLTAVLIYDENRIVVDNALPPIKREWPSFHEVSHRVIGWHKPYFYGDTAQTLDPDWQENLEAEANYGASTMMFCGPVFTAEALDTVPGWKSVEGLKARYGKTYPTTLRRYVEYGPDCPMAFLVSTLPGQKKPTDQDKQWRHFVRSPQFVREFGGVTAEELLARVEGNILPRRRGPAGDFTIWLRDDNGERHDFHTECFNNTYYIMTLITHAKKRTAKRIIFAKPS